MLKAVRAAAPRHPYLWVGELGLSQEERQRHERRQASIGGGPGGDARRARARQPRGGGWPAGWLLDAWLLLST
jgi:hypothetical protein